MNSGNVMHQAGQVVTANAAELIARFDLFASNVTTVSFDCFDTLIWRRAVTPVDVFFDLQHAPRFKKHRLSAALRIQAEKKARGINRVAKERTEVTLADIYGCFSQELSDREMDALADDELAAEQKTCYAFLPMVELLRHAHGLGKKIIIVSDIYFGKTQLSKLLRHCLPPDAFTMIDEIFCSADFGYSKSQGLFKLVLDKLKLTGMQLLHIGDNPIADVTSATNENIQAIHFQQFHPSIQELFRMHSVAASIFIPDIRHTKSMINPFKPLLVHAAFDDTSPEKFIGAASLGPIMFAFSRYLRDEVNALKAAGKNPKLLFLMRDGYLPSLGFHALNPDIEIYRVRISRFVSIAASFKSARDINEYLASMVESRRFDEICQQLLLPDKIKHDVLLATKAENFSTRVFTRLIREPHVVKIILQESQKCRDRLILYLKKEADMSAGDTLVFVDLGYYCTTQRMVGPILRELGIEVLGRYLISFNTHLAEEVQAGLINSTQCDVRAANTLVAYIALLEQLCTEDAKSVMDYDVAGNPLFSETSVSKSQNALLHVIQEEALQFIKAADAYFAKSETPLSLDELRDTAMAYIGRLLFFPTQQEVDYFESFQFELNMGTADLLKMIDQDSGLEKLRRKGLFFMKTGVSSKKFTTNFPSEVRSASMELSLAFLTHYRYGIDMNLQDLSLRREALRIIVIYGAQSMQSIVYAQPTYDGYFSLLVPAESAQMQIGIIFGASFRWVQIDCVQAMKLDALYSEQEEANSVDVTANVVLDQMVDRGAGLFECLGDTSLAILAAPVSFAREKTVFRVVFRPLSKNTLNVSQKESVPKRVSTLM